MAWRNWQATKDYLGVNYIHPLKQREVEMLVDNAKNIPEIRKIVIFGSATSNRCTEFSDIDVLVVGHPTRPIGLCPVGTPSEFDIHYAENIPPNSELRQEILRDGVLVYDADTPDNTSTEATAASKPQPAQS